jgi:hypothetical protein
MMLPNNLYQTLGLMMLPNNLYQTLGLTMLPNNLYQTLRLMMLPNNLYHVQRAITRHKSHTLNDHANLQSTKYCFYVICHQMIGNASYFTHDLKADSIRCVLHDLTNMASVL